MTAPAASHERLRAWTALLLPPLAWYGFEVGLASALRVSCSTVGAWLGPAWGIVSLCVCALGLWIARPLARPADDKTPSHPWLARVAFLGTGIFALAIAFQTLAALIIPSCAR
jgi:hypothetical protein